ncbi:MAG: dTDP-4-dehydrorhamnose 3,5-epimerase [Steroidobacteraceae bacterium]
MKIGPTSLPDVLRLEPTVHGDARGFFFEAWTSATLQSAGIDATFVQGNVSGSARGVLRGLHYQWPNPQGKLVTVAAGEIFDVAVDVRRDSPSFGRWAGEKLTAGNRRSLWIPPGFAHGFMVLSDFAQFTYLVTAPYDPGAEMSVRWDDPQIGIEWPTGSPTLSARDAAAPRLAELPPERLPTRAALARLVDLVDDARD